MASTEESAGPWLTPGVTGIGAASFLADAGHEVPTALLPSLLTSTLGAPASALGLIEGVSDGFAGLARLGGGVLADDPARRRSVAVGGYSSTAVLAGLTGAATAAWHVGVLRAGAWAARGLRVPARNALLADIAPPGAYGRAYGFERAMDNLGAIAGPLLALGLVAAFGNRTAIGLSVIPGLLAAGIAIGCVETAEHAVIASAAPTHARGSAFGVLAAIQSFGNLAASGIAGLLWTAVSPTAAFAYLAAWMLVALALLLGGQLRQVIRRWPLHRWIR